MGIHASPVGAKAGVKDILRAASRIASNAQEGQILISGEARSRVSTIDNVELKPKKEHLELTLGQGPDTEDKIELLELFEVDHVLSVALNPQERSALLQQNPASKAGGGFQAFLVGLQERLDRKTDTLRLTVSDRARIARYAHDYKGGGWQGRLRKIFGRALGSDLGRKAG